MEILCLPGIFLQAPDAFRPLYRTGGFFMDQKPDDFPTYSEPEEMHVPTDSVTAVVADSVSDTITASADSVSAASAAITDSLPGTTPAPAAPLTEAAENLSEESYHFRAEMTTAPSAEPQEVPNAAFSQSAPISPNASAEQSSQIPSGSQIPPQGMQQFQTFYNPYYNPAMGVPYPMQPPKKEHKFAKKFFGAIALGLCFGVIACGSFIGVRYACKRFLPNIYNAIVPEDAVAKKEEQPSAPVAKEPDDSRFRIPTVSPVETENTQTGDIVTKVVEQTMPAMVSIESKIVASSYYFGIPYSSEGSSSGSGIIVGSNEAELLIATNYHVVENASAISVTLTDGTSHAVTVKGSDVDADLAIVALPLSDLTAETKDAIDIAVLGDSDSTKVGQMVVAIGNALGYGRSVTVGYLSAKEREVVIDGRKMILLQTDAAINPGNSGGALLNLNGEVIGINNAKTATTDVEGICYAIPISKATPILKEMMSREILSDEEKGYLGVTVSNLDSAIFEAYNWPEGVYVSDLAKGGSAEVAGIYRGDIITHINGTHVASANQLVNLVTSHRVGETLEVTLQRIQDGEFVEIKINVTLQKNPNL